MNCKLVCEGLISSKSCDTNVDNWEIYSKKKVNFKSEISAFLRAGGREPSIYVALDKLLPSVYSISFVFKKCGLWLFVLDSRVIPDSWKPPKCLLSANIMLIQMQSEYCWFPLPD